MTACAAPWNSTVFAGAATTCRPGRHRGVRTRPGRAAGRGPRLRRHRSTHRVPLRRRGRWHAGYSPGAWSVADDLAARLGRASGMRVLFPEYRLAGRGSRRTAPASRRAAAGPCHRCCPHPRSSQQPGSEPSGPAFTPHRWPIRTCSSTRAARPALGPPPGPAPPETRDSGHQTSHESSPARVTTALARCPLQPGDGSFSNSYRPRSGGKSPSRYGDLSLPYVVAVSETLSTLFDPTPHRTNVLFGSLKFMYGDALGPRWVRASDGIWRGPGAHPRNRRLAAVLFASQLTPWTVDQAELEWWDNPFANRPVPEDLLPDVARRMQMLPGQARENSLQETQPARTPGSVLSSGSYLTARVSARGQAGLRRSAASRWAFRQSIG